MALMNFSALIIYLDVWYDMPGSEPYLMYWPSENSPISLPYLAIRKTEKWC